MSRYVVNIHFDGCIQFYVEAEDAEEAKEKGESHFADLDPENIVAAICESFAEDAIKEG